MPLYEYLCDACGHRFEVICKFSDPPLEKCPKCGGPVHKLQSAPAIQFKGSGFYITDYAKKEHVAAARADKDGKDTKDTKGTKDTKETKDTKDTKTATDAGDKSSKADTKAESKTEAKTEKPTASST